MRDQTALLRTVGAGILVAALVVPWGLGAVGSSGSASDLSASHALRLVEPSEVLAAARSSSLDPGAPQGRSRSLAMPLALVGFGLVCVRRIRAGTLLRLAGGVFSSALRRAPSSRAPPLRAA